MRNWSECVVDGPNRYQCDGLAELASGFNRGVGLDHVLIEP